MVFSSRGRSPTIFASSGAAEAPRQEPAPGEREAGAPAAPTTCNRRKVLGSGIDILIQHLAPNTQYGVNLWSYDEASGGGRVSDWIEAISNTTIYASYTFDGNSHPTADWQHTLGALLTSDPSGQLDIQGTQNGLSSGFGVFLNALTVTANPLESPF